MHCREFGSWRPASHGIKRGGSKHPGRARRQPLRPTPAGVAQGGSRAAVPSLPSAALLRSSCHRQLRRCRVAPQRGAPFRRR
jgi:hypothetical protein